MSSFNLYIHGTPNGHQIWGSAKNHDYISTFYNHDIARTDKSALQIDICMGDSYYTYIRQQNVYDSNERPGAFFAITICFTKAYCTNVYKLYQIFEAVYNQVCIGSLISQKQGKEIYLISDFESSRSGNSTTVDRIRAIFVKNIGELIEPYLLSFENIGDTFNKAKKQFSLLEVDSPLFFDFFKKQSIIVLPNLEPASIVNQTITKQLSIVNAQKNALETANAQLQSDNVSLTNENKSLANQLHTSVSSSEKKYSATINQLKADLKVATQERDELKDRIEEVKSSVDLIDKPIQKLVRLLAGRFPDSNRSSVERTDKISQKSSSKNSHKVWQSWLNSILLGIITVLCIAILYFIVPNISDKNNTSNVSHQEQVGDTILHESTNHLDKAEFTDDYDSEVYNGLNAESEESDSSYDKWDECMINIRNGGGDELIANHLYTLLVTKGREQANVPVGEWIVEIDPGHPINRGNSFTIPENTPSETCVQIKYIVNNTTVMVRTPKVK